MLEDAWALEYLLLHLDLLSQIVDRLQFVDTVEKIADILDDLSLFVIQGHLLFQACKCFVDCLIVGHHTRILVLIDVE